MVSELLLPDSGKVRWARINQFKAAVRYVQDVHLGLSSIERCFATPKFLSFWKGLLKKSGVGHRRRPS